MTNGVFNKPTALNNVETFANVPQILMNGVDWYKAQGQGGAAELGQDKETWELGS